MLTSLDNMWGYLIGCTHIERVFVDGPQETVNFLLLVQRMDHPVAVDMSAVDPVLGQFLTDQLDLSLFRHCWYAVRPSFTWTVVSGGRHTAENSHMRMKQGNAKPLLNWELKSREYRSQVLFSARLVVFT